MSDAITTLGPSVRIWALRAVFFLLLPLAVLMKPAFVDTTIGEMLEMTGLALIIAGVLGRFWSILYIGGRKSREIVQDGPYSMCRHPLYLFSTTATMGFGLMTQSLVFTALLTAIVFAILNYTASREERKLRTSFGAGAYDAYAARVPKIIPNLALYRSAEFVTFNVQQLRINLFDALVFLALIPLAELLEWTRSQGIGTVFVLP